MATFATLVSLLFIFILDANKSAEAAKFFCSSGDVTCLIAAITAANEKPGRNVIQLEPGIYTIQAGLPLIRRSIEIVAGSDAAPTIIEGSADSLVAIFGVSLGGELLLDGLVIRKGRGGAEGPGAIGNAGTTTLRGTVITDSTRNGADGAIINTGTLNVFSSAILDNVSLTGHFSGAINNQQGTVLIENSTIANNTAIGAGGILNRGSLVIKNSAIISNRTDCCQSGGGINNRGSATIINSTIARNFGPLNSAPFGGGGIANGGSISIINSTITENRTAGLGGGIRNFFSGVVQIQNSILAGNTSEPGQFPAFGGPDCSGTITSLGNNLFGDPTDCGVTLQPTDLTGDPGLGALVDDEEPGEVYYPVLAGSPVINAGNKHACPNKDQLGNNRQGRCDIGAVDFRP